MQPPRWRCASAANLGRMTARYIARSDLDAIPVRKDHIRRNDRRGKNLVNAQVDVIVRLCALQSHRFLAATQRTHATRCHAAARVRARLVRAVGNVALGRGRGKHFTDGQFDVIKHVDTVLSVGLYTTLPASKRSTTAPVYATTTNVGAHTFARFLRAFAKARGAASCCPSPERDDRASRERLIVIGLTADQLARADARACERVDGRRRQCDIFVERRCREHFTNRQIDVVKHVILILLLIRTVGISSLRSV